MQITVVSVAIHDRDQQPDDEGAIVMTLHSAPGGFVFDLQEVGNSGSVTLTDEELAARLDCRVTRIRQARELHHALQCTSLDKPSGGDDGASLQECLEAGGRQPLEHLAWQELRERLRGLPALDRKLLVDCLMHGRPRREVATEIGWTVPRLSRRLQQCRRALRERLMAEGWGPAEPSPERQPAWSSVH